MTSAQIGRTHPDWAPSKDESRTTPGPASPCRQPKDRVSCPWRIPMRLLMFVLCVISSFGSLSAQKPVWQPSPGHTQISIWPGAAPDPQPVAGPEYAETSGKDFLPGGRPAVGVSNVTRPTMTVYSPKGKNTGAAVVVFLPSCARIRRLKVCATSEFLDLPALFPHPLDKSRLGRAGFMPPHTDVADA